MLRVLGFEVEEPGKGSGLGQAQEFGIERQTGGGVKITTRLGVGTTVAVFLPRAKRLDEQEATAPEQANVKPREGVTVLVVYVVSAVREVSSAVLRDHGFVVEEAGSGARALERLMNGGRSDALGADYAMPGMYGAELATLARARLPDVPIVFASGHADTAAVETALGGQATILRKPFNMETLARTIAGLLR